MFQFGGERSTYLSDLVFIFGWWHLWSDYQWVFKNDGVKNNNNNNNRRLTVNKKGGCLSIW